MNYDANKASHLFVLQRFSFAQECLSDLASLGWVLTVFQAQPLLTRALGKLSKATILKGFAALKVTLCPSS